MGGENDFVSSAGLELRGFMFSLRKLVLYGMSSFGHRIEVCDMAMRMLCTNNEKSFSIGLSTEYRLAKA